MSQPINKGPAANSPEARQAEREIARIRSEYESFGDEIVDSWTYVLPTDSTVRTLDQRMIVVVTKYGRVWQAPLGDNTEWSEVTKPVPFTRGRLSFNEIEEQRGIIQREARRAVGA